MRRLIQSWWAALVSPDGDPLIDDLITCNRYAYRPGMESASWAIIGQKGAETWRDTVKGQRRLAKKAKAA